MTTLKKETEKEILEEIDSAVEKYQEETHAIIINTTLQVLLARALLARFDGAGFYGGNLGEKY